MALTPQLTLAREASLSSQLQERAAFYLLLLSGLAPRLFMTTKFPTIPISDFHFLVVLGSHLREHGIFTNGWFWEYFNPGLPLFFCGLFHITPGLDPEALARFVTAVGCGLVPLLPFLIWRGVLPLWVRFLAGAALALWPGQILFTGTVAQDNWVLLPAVALAALAVRSILSTEAHPIAAALLYAATTSVRQEMLVASLPLFIAAAGIRPGVSRRRLIVAAIAAAVPLLALAAYRDAATGRFAIGTQHSGLSILGAYIPGAASDAWVDPFPYIASVRPDLFEDHQALLSEATRLALREALRRPFFQFTRIISSLCTFAVTGEAVSLYWSISAPEVLPPELRQRGAAVSDFLQRPLRLELAGIQGLFLAAILIGLWGRKPHILVPASAVLLKYGLHGVTVSQGRYFYAATALELLAIALAAAEARAMFFSSRRLFPTRALAIGAVFSVALLLCATPLASFVQRRDVDHQRTYRFPLRLDDQSAKLDCVVERGFLGSLIVPPGSAQSAAIRTYHHDPAPGESAVASCELTGAGPSRPLSLWVLDSYAPGNRPGRMIQRVELDGVEVFSHDIARDPGSGWAGIPLGPVGAGTRRKITIEVKALRPDPGSDWGDAALTSFELMR